VKFGLAVSKICVRSDRQTDRQTTHHNTPHPYRGGVTWKLCSRIDMLTIAGGRPNPSPNPPFDLGVSVYMLRTISTDNPFSF